MPLFPCWLGDWPSAASIREKSTQWRAPGYFITYKSWDVRGSRAQVPESSCETARTDTDCKMHAVFAWVPPPPAVWKDHVVSEIPTEEAAAGSAEVTTIEDLAYNRAISFPCDASEIEASLPLEHLAAPSPKANNLDVEIPFVSLQWFKLAETTKSSIEAIPAKYHVNLEAGADIWEDGKIRAELVASGKMGTFYRNARCLAVTRLRSLYAEALAGLAECCLKGAAKFVECSSGL
ncbi:hypothetical protein AK812_SmicGene3740 [Symbiodinium microadriaticum]|uniref:Uncharacterized protein n=1 Tax=Symbiodinium microadriaticum TaxID=2951 RepID=A0A1Q9EY11_SYMMI|nr:hypothetical protein AK812_SmicGene3740 [Symbiodinium microadriaticum]